MMSKTVSASNDWHTNMKHLKNLVPLLVMLLFTIIMHFTFPNISLVEGRSHCSHKYCDNGATFTNEEELQQARNEQQPQ